jgi:S-formylglutathione hydrolase FrmB
VPADRYEDTDLQSDVVRKYRTINSRYGRAIAGLSMGGYGALKVALKRPEAFAVAGSFSGAFSITAEEGTRTRLGAGEQEQVRKIFGGTEGAARRKNDVRGSCSATNSPLRTQRPQRSFRNASSSLRPQRPLRCARESGSRRASITP